MKQYLCRSLRPEELNIICIDPSLRSTGVLLCKQGKITTYAIQRKEERIELLGWFLKHFVNLAKSEDWDLVVIENYSFGSHSRSITVQAELGGIIRSIFSGYKVPIIELPIPTWKALTKLKSNKQKKDVYLNEVCNKFEYRFKTTDEADAFMIFYSIRKISQGKAGKIGLNVKHDLEELGIQL